MKVDTHGKPVVIVTGAMGFLGSHLVDRLIANGKFVIGLDILGQTGSGSFTNLDHVNYENFWPLIADACWDGLMKYIEECFEGNRIREIYYLASPASPVHYLKYPLMTIHANTIGLENFLKMAHKWKAPILFTSTSEIYGDPDISPQSETYNGNVDPLGDRSVYDEAKRLGETLMMTYFREYDVQAKIVRLFNTYGPRMTQDDGRVIPTFICNALRNKEIPIMGDGSQTRSFGYVLDTIKGIIEVMNFCPAGAAYNIGNGESHNYYSVLALAYLILNNIPESSSSVSYIPYLSQNDPKIRRPDTSKIESYTGWLPFIDIKEGLSKTIEYFRGKLNDGY